MKEAKKMQADLERTQGEIAAKEFDATAGGGAVEVRVSGTKEIKSIKIKKEVVDSEDVEMLEDLILSCVNEALRKVDAEYVVIKNNITRRALEECGITDLGDALVGPTAVIIAKEAYLPALKEIYKYSKDNEFYKMKGGVLEGKVSSIEELTTLAQLPSREELIAKLAGCLLANVSKLAATLDAVRAKKESEQ
jgi:DNA-binding YbaB/EbfC family protein